MVRHSGHSYHTSEAALCLLTTRRACLLCLYLLLGISVFSGSQHSSLRNCAHPANTVQPLPEHKELNLPLSLPPLLLQYLHAVLHQRMPSLLTALSCRYFCLYQGNYHRSSAENYSLQAEEVGANAVRQGVDPRIGLFLHVGSKSK